MKSIIINAFSVKEACQKAVETGLFNAVQIHATQSWKNAGEPTHGSINWDEFAENYTRTRLKNMPGIGAIITLDKGQENTRLKPFTIENVKTDGPRKMETVYVLYEKLEDGKLLVHDRIVGTKADAKDALKEIYMRGSKAETIYVEVMRQVKDDESEALALIGHYSPSTNENLGTYIIFGEIDA